MRTSPPRCRRFRPHPWRKGICIDCFMREHDHTTDSEDGTQAAAGRKAYAVPTSSASLDIPDYSGPHSFSKSGANSCSLTRFSPSSCSLSDAAGRSRWGRSNSSPLDITPIQREESPGRDDDRNETLQAGSGDAPSRGNLARRTLSRCPEVQEPEEGTFRGASESGTSPHRLSSSTSDHGLGGRENSAANVSGDSMSAAPRRASVGEAVFARVSTSSRSSSQDCGSVQSNNDGLNGLIESGPESGCDTPTLSHGPDVFFSSTGPGDDAELSDALLADDPLPRSSPVTSLKRQQLRLSLNTEEQPGVIHQRGLSETDRSTPEDFESPSSAKSSLKRLIRKVISRAKEKSPGKPSNKDDDSYPAMRSREHYDSDSSSAYCSKRQSVTSTPPGLVSLQQGNRRVSRPGISRQVSFSETSSSNPTTSQRSRETSSECQRQGFVLPNVVNGQQNVQPIRQPTYQQQSVHEIVHHICPDYLESKRNSMDEIAAGIQTSISVTSCLQAGENSERSWSEYFDVLDVNPLIHEELSSIHSGLKAVWSKSLELTTMILPSDIEKAAASWDDLHLIGYDLAPHPSTLYAHLEYNENGVTKLFSMEIEMGVPKRNKFSLAARDWLVREAVAPHFNILLPHVRLSQRLPLEIECKMDMATSDLVARTCYVTDFLGNYVNGHGFVSLCLAGKKLKDYEERVILLVLQLLHALEHAHEHGIVHRCVELDKILIGSVQGLSGDRLLLSGFEYALSASSDKRVKVEACAHPPPEWFVYDVNELMYLGCNIGHLPPEIIGLCDSSPQLDFSCVDAYAVGVFISELLEVFEDNHPTVLRFISTAMMAPAPSIRLSLTKARRILECWLWGPQGWFKRGKEQADDIPFARSDVRRWLLHRQTALLSTVALRGMLDQLTVGDLLHCCFLSSARASHIISSGQWLQRLAAIGKI